MGEVQPRPHTFFSVGPADLAKPECFAMKRGDAIDRLDTWFNHPRYEVTEARLEAASLHTPALGELLLSIAGGATPTRSDSTLYSDSGVKFLRIMNVEDGEINDRDLKYIADGVHRGELSRSKLSAGDVLVTITGRVGSAAVVSQELLPANINQHIARLRVDPKRCRPEFLSEWLNCPAGQELSNRPVSGGTRAALDYGSLRELRVPLPSSLDEQDRLLLAMRAARAERNAKLVEAQALRSSVDDFVLEDLGIAPHFDHSKVFAVTLRDLHELHLGAMRYAPPLQAFLKSLRRHPSASKPLGAFVEINPAVDSSGLQDQATVGFVPMNSVADGATGEYTYEERLLHEVRKGYTPFNDGDILWAKITPCMQNGKTCIVNGLPNARGFGSTEFHVLSVQEHGVLAEFVREFISQKTLRMVAIHAFTGSAGQQRIPASFLKELPFPRISAQHQRKIIDHISSIRQRAYNLQREADASWEKQQQWFERQLLAH